MRLGSSETMTKKGRRPFGATRDEAGSLVGSEAHTPGYQCWEYENKVGG